MGVIAAVPPVPAPAIDIVMGIFMGRTIDVFGKILNELAIPLASVNVKFTAVNTDEVTQLYSIIDDMLVLFVATRVHNLHYIVSR